MLKEFKDFINKGGIFEAGVGLVMALSFVPVVGSMVDDLIMPIVARVLGQPDFSDLTIGLGGDKVCTPDPAGGADVCVEAAIRYGSFITVLFSFAIIGFVIFNLVKLYNRATNKVEEETGPSDIDLLTEIRDSLKRG